MRKVLIVIESEELRLALTNTLKNKYELLVCGDVPAAHRLLSLNPDGMILDLHLQGIDGLDFLESIAGNHPPVVLALTWLLSSYVEQAMDSLKVGYVLRLPVSLSAVDNRLEDMFRKLDSAKDSGKDNSLHFHLQRLGLRSDRVGYSRLLTAITLFSRDTQQTLFKDVYPIIAKDTGSNCNAIDNAIHDLIKSAWESRDPALWQSYFPRETHCPKNKNFIAVMSAYIQ